MVLKVAQQLLENEFTQLLKTEGRDTFCAGKQVGNCIYCVIAINADMPEYKLHFERLSAFLGSNFSQKNANIVIVGLFVTNNLTGELKQFATADVERFEKLNYIKWVVTSGGVQVFGNQPSKLINLRQIIDAALEDNAETGSKSLEEIVEQTKSREQARIISRNTALTFAVIGIIAVCYLFQIAFDDAVWQFALVPFKECSWYRYFTYMFMHGDVRHLLSNALSLYIFGTRVERYYGKRDFVIIYLLGGIMAGFTSSVFLQGYGVGASGAIFALMGAVLCYGLRTRKSLDGFDLYFIILFALIGLTSGSLFTGIDNVGHISGLIYGFVISNVLFGFKKRI